PTTGRATARKRPMTAGSVAWPGSRPTGWLEAFDTMAGRAPRPMGAVFVLGRLRRTTSRTRDDDPALHRAGHTGRRRAFGAGRSTADGAGAEPRGQASGQPVGRRAAGHCAAAGAARGVRGWRRRARAVPDLAAGAAV